MSEQRTYSIVCPRCKHPMDVQLYDSINVKVAPELKEKLMLNQVNAVTCQKCELGFRVDKPLLYSDPSRQMLIYWIPTCEDAYDEGEEEFGSWVREMSSVLPEGVRAPDVHLVFTRIELVERIFMLENKLDERIIEYIKYLIYNRNVGKINPAEKALLFNAEDSSDENLCFVVQDLKTRQLETVLKYGRDAYKALCETFNHEDKTGDLLELFPGPYISARSQLLRELRAEAQRE